MVGDDTVSAEVAARSPVPMARSAITRPVRKDQSSAEVSCVYTTSDLSGNGLQITSNGGLLVSYAAVPGAEEVLPGHKFVEAATDQRNSMLPPDLTIRETPVCQHLFQQE